MALVNGTEYYFIDMQQASGGNTTRHLLKDTNGRAMIAPTEASSTASAAHAKGSYFIYGTTLYQATADIASGGTITPNTNCRAVTLGSDVSDLKSALLSGGTTLITDDMYKRKGWIASGKWANTGSNTYAHRFYPIAPGDTLVMNATNSTTWGVLTSAADPVQGEDAPLSTVEGFRDIFSLSANASTGQVTMPSDAKFLYVNTTANDSRLPTIITINGRKVRETVYDQLDDDIKANTENIKNSMMLSMAFGTALADGTDLDDVTDAGNYRISSASSAQTIGHVPEETAGKLIVLYTVADIRKIQIYIANAGDPNVYVRFYNGTTWYAWRKVTYDFSQFAKSKNLLPSSEKTVSYLDCDVTYNNGLIDVNGTASASGGQSNACTDEFLLRKGTYTMSLTYGNRKALKVVLKDSDNNDIAAVQYITNPVTFTLSSAKTCKLGVQVGSGTTYAHAKMYVQIEEGEYQTAYESPSYQTAIDHDARRFAPNILSAFSNIECVGDSLTWGAVYTSDSSYRQAHKPYPVIMGQLTGATMTALATAGFNATEWWNEYEDQIEAKPNALAIIFLGTNGGLSDTLSTDAPTDTAAENWANTHTGNYAKIVNAYLTAGYKVLLVQCFMASADIETTNDVIRQIADRFKCGLVSNEYFADISYHDTPDRTYSNTLHYNDLGYAAMANQIAHNVDNMSIAHKSYIIPE